MIDVIRRTPQPEKLAPPPKRPSGTESFIDAFMQELPGLAEKFVENRNKAEEENRKQTKTKELLKGLEDITGVTGLENLGTTDPAILGKILDYKLKSLETGNKKDLNKQRSIAINKSRAGQELTPEDRELFSPAEIMALDKQQQGPKQGITEKPVPAEVSQNINKILERSPESDADELKLQFDMAGIPPVYSNQYVETRRRLDERKETLAGEKVKLSQKRDNDLLTSAEKIRDALPLDEAALNSMNDAIISGDQSGLSLNNIAEQTGLEWFRNAAGGQFKTAGKTFLINNISKFGGRPNMYIEKQMVDALPKVGRSRSANMISVEALKFDSNIKRQQAEIIDKIDEEGDYKPGTLGRKVQKEMRKFVEMKQKELVDKIKFIKENELKIDETPKGYTPMMDDSGNLIYVPEDRIDEVLLRGARSL